MVLDGGGTAARGKALPLHTVAQRLGVSVKTVRRMLRRGRFPGAVKLDQAWRVYEADVDQFLVSRRCPPVAASGR